MVAGQRYGRLIAVELVERDANRQARWRFKCDCGNETVAYAHSVRASKIGSCGCLAAELRGPQASAYKHGKIKTGEYSSWRAMKQRCYLPTHASYPNYGGRGIKVCDRWRESFEAFYEDMGPRPSASHSMDRINSDGDYEPANCRWAARTEQNRNTSRNHKVMYQGKKMSLAEACQLAGVAYNTVQSRLARGWDLDRALTP